jgi:hypothetical protein
VAATVDAVPRPVDPSVPDWPFRISDHAVARFIERVRPVSEELARSALERLGLTKP